MDEPDEIDPASNLPVFEFSSAIFEELQKGSPPDPSIITQVRRVYSAL